MFEYFDYNKLANSNVEKTFKDTIELYYSKKHRECIVTLYSLAIYDLFIKLNKLSEMNYKDSKKKILELKTKINNNEHFSVIEKDIISYFKEKFNEYFYKFIEDIEYLQTLRNKCAHLYLNDLELFVPHESKVRMLIISIYSNLLSMPIPFISNIMDVAQYDIEMYSDYNIEDLEDSKEISKKIIDKYYSKMLDNVLQKSLDTLLKLTFKSNENEPLKYVKGLYVFLDTLLKYLNYKGKANIIEKSNARKIINDLSLDSMNRERLNLISRIAEDDYTIMKYLKENNEIYFEVKQQLLKRSYLMIEYKNFFSDDTFESLFVNNTSIVISDYFKFNDFLSEYQGYSLDVYCLNIVHRVPTFNAYDEADNVFDFILANVDKIKISYLDKILERHMRNRQFRERERALVDLKKIKKYIMGKQKANEQFDITLNYIKKLLENTEVPCDEEFV